jgi:streptogramin lyase
MTSSLPEPDPARLAIAHLNALAVDLDGVGFLTCVFHEGGALKLQVTNQAVPSCRETITVTPDDDGAWWFLWSWGDRITLVGDVAAAAFKVAYVLTPQAG